MNEMEVKEEVDTAIKESAILVYSKSYCPHSRRAKAILERVPDKPSEARVIELDELGERGVQMQSYLAELTHQRTVPNIFIHQKHIGGADDLSHLDQAGVLRSLIVDHDSSRDTKSSSRIFKRQPDLKTLHEGVSYPLLLLLLLVILAGIGYRIKSRAWIAPVPQKQKL
ncbi:glutaredoxin [Puccinia graminis f. sp. tritici]|uniref:Glutaredoxin n=1 Tax=Puccinia graminis f. sp. tritici TaxID=56615 RepID=A0A5B0NC44_PUCGR|nr:glutaredoxin [Puccinia graminis f. sp. tritici]